MIGLRLMFNLYLDVLLTAAGGVRRQRMQP
jgi:hypothetical protein